MGDALPRGWSGSDADHRLSVAGHKIRVQRGESDDGATVYEWFTRTSSGESRFEGCEDSAPLARHAALTALIALLTTATREAESALAGLEP